jgi:hypothetical protein
MNVPYNNGKIKMGIYYQKPRYVEHDSDMLALQNGLIGDPRKARINYWANVSYRVLLVFVMLVIFFKNKG